jgi:thymidine kinase
MSSKGKLRIYYGCMFAGKTSALIQYISEQNLKSNEFIVLKPAVDVRAGKAVIATHDGKTHECIVFDNDMELIDFITPFTKLVAIDEAQFFNKVILSDLKRILGKGIEVVASGLDKDYLGRPFGLIPALMELADDKIQLKAECSVCGEQAEYTYRKVDNKVLLLIGHSDHYEPRCGKCFGEN